MSKRHVAQTGKQAGQWVRCNAKNCRNGGTHITTEELRAARDWQAEKTGQKATALAAVPLTAVISYDSAPEAEKQAARDRVAAADKEKHRVRAEQEAERRAMQDRLARAAEALPGVYSAKVKADGEAARKKAALETHALMRTMTTHAKERVDMDPAKAMDEEGEQATRVASSLGLRDEDKAAFKFAVLLAGTHNRLFEMQKAEGHSTQPVGMGLKGIQASTRLMVLGYKASSYARDSSPENKQKFDTSLREFIQLGQTELANLEARRARDQKEQERKQKQKDLTKKIFGLFVKSAR